MSEQRKKFLINMLSGLILAVGILILNWQREQSIFHRLCDAFFVAGVLLMGMGGLKAARNAGTFDMMSYGITSALHITFPWMKSNSPLEDKEEDFVAYQERKRETRKPAGDLLLAGGIYLAISVICLLIYKLTG